MKVTTRFGRAAIKGAAFSLGLLAVGGIYEGVHRLITDEDDYEEVDTEEEDEESE